MEKLLANQGRPIVSIEYFSRNCWLDLGPVFVNTCADLAQFTRRESTHLHPRLSLFSSSVLPFVSIVHLWSGSPRGRRRAMRLSLSFFFFQSSLVPSYLGPVQSSCCLETRSSPFFFLFFLSRSLFLSFSLPFLSLRLTSAVASLTDCIL